MRATIRPVVEQATVIDLLHRRFTLAKEVISSYLRKTGQKGIEIASNEKTGESLHLRADGRWSTQLNHGPIHVRDIYEPPSLVSTFARLTDPTIIAIESQPLPEDAFGYELRLQVIRGHIEAHNKELRERFVARVMSVADQLVQQKPSKHTKIPKSS